MPFSPLLKVNFTAALALVGCVLGLLVAVIGRPHRRFQWIRWYLALCLGYSGLSYLIPSHLPIPLAYHWIDLTALLLYSLLEGWLIFLFLRNEPFPPTRGKALDIATSVFFYFWILIWLGSPRFLLADTATMMAAEALTVTVLALVGLDSSLNSHSFTHFLKSNTFHTLLGTVGYFSFCIPVFLLLVLLEAHEHPDTVVTQTNELITYSGFFLLLRKDYNALPFS